MSEHWSRPEHPPEMSAAAREHFDKLRHARQHIDPFGTYTLRLPDGSVFECDGASAIATAEASVAVVDAIGRGEDPRVIMAAFDRLNGTIEPGTV
jgi:hypothetical protein